MCPGDGSEERRSRFLNELLLFSDGAMSECPMRHGRVEQNGKRRTAVAPVGYVGGRPL